MKHIKDFAEITRPYYIVIGTPVGYRLSNGKVLFGENTIQKIKNIFGIPQYGHLFYSGYVENDSKYHNNLNSNENRTSFRAEYKGGSIRHGIE